MLVVVNAAKIDRLRALLGESGAGITFTDMMVVGSNPARIIAVWKEFVSRQDDARPIRGIGEPIWPGRTPAELVECQRHEELLNLAFAETAGWRLLCPYDVDALDESVIAEARRSHPFILENGTRHHSEHFAGLEAVEAPFDAPLLEPSSPATVFEFDDHGLKQVRTSVGEHARAAGLDTARTSDLILAVNEVATNSLRHGDGGGRLRIWTEDGALICEVQDHGRIDQPLVGRVQPPLTIEGGRGLWLVNQICELVQVRTFASGSVVRMHMRLP
jgi:anti-sigma regulatory factor (Ser/Thr protein kinase)